MNSNLHHIRLIAFYLPQFHPIPENDKWWGKGFTEWANVAKAKPLFRGHYQPHIPADLGFYDLRVPETRIAQAELAREYGIEGFCYYHYWFNGKRLLNVPLDEVLDSGKPNFPFCLCWANEDWTRTWDGRSSDFLIKQKYSFEDDRNHIRWLADVFKDKRYIRYEGKPLFLVYRASNLPDPKATTEIWREEAEKLGIGEIFLCKVESFTNERGNPEEIGFDAAIEFQPDWRLLQRPLFRGKLRKFLSLFIKSLKVYQEHRIFKYKSLVEKSLEKPVPNYKWFRCVTPSWDNSGRRKRDSVILTDSTPDMYYYWLKSVVLDCKNEKENECMVFINAWNEWGEGSHLEPDLEHGRAYLEATLKALKLGE